MHERVPRTVDSDGGPRVKDNVATLAQTLGERLPASVGGRSAVAGLTFGVVGALTAAVIVGVGAAMIGLDGTLNADFETLGTAVGLPVAAGIGAAVVGGPAWWALVERTDSPSIGRGVLVGIAAGTLSHPVMWFLFGVGVVVYALVEQGVGAVSAAGSGTVGGAIALYLLFTVFGFVLTAVLTVPAGVLAGAGLAFVRARVPEPPDRGVVRDW